MVILAIAPAAAAGGYGEMPHLHAGDYELGLAGSLVTVEGSTRTDWAVRAGRFLAAGPGLLPVGIEAAWVHVRDDDVLDLTASVAWTSRVGQGPLWPYVAAVGGWRQEWIGSYREARFPLGGAAGVRVLVTEGAALRLEWRALHVLDDPASAFLEQRVSAGVSLLFQP